MSKIDIIRAWKDEEYRASLSETDLAQLPENPAGLMELTDTEMEAMAGGLRIYLTLAGTTLWAGGGSAVDACPSARGCTYVGCAPRTADSCGIVACV